ncbi:MAG: hypothetical protein ABSH41_14695 [Syntrophobacteraceae bacterium]
MNHEEISRESLIPALQLLGKHMAYLDKDEVKEVWPYYEMLRKESEKAEGDFNPQVAREAARAAFELEGSLAERILQFNFEQELEKLSSWQELAGLGAKQLRREAYLAYSEFLRVVDKYLPELGLAPGTTQIVEEQLNILRQEVAKGGAINREVTRPVVVILWDLIGEKLSQYVDRTYRNEIEVIRAWSYSKIRFNRERNEK